MTKNLEELTNDWQDEKLDDGLYYIRLVGFWETDKGNGVIVETDDGEQRLLSHEQYNDLMKARKSKGKKNETA